MTARPDLVLVGAVTGAFGVRGEVRTRAFTADPESLGAYGPLLHADGRVALTPKRVRPVGEDVAITAPEAATREAAEAMRGTGLYVPRAALPEPEDEEFYHVDLIGCTVEALDGAALGTVKAVHDFGAGTLLEIKPLDGQSWFLPFTKAAAPIVELAAKRIVSVEGPPKASDKDHGEE
jgi:16S rRNA processing protein RimM